MGSLRDCLGEQSVKFFDDVTKEQAVSALCEAVARAVGLEPQRVMSVVMGREKLLTTGIGLGIAMPHARMSEADRFALALGISKRGIEYASLDNKPVHIIVLMIGPARSHTEYLQFMARVTMVLRQERFRQALLAANTPAEVLRVVEQF